MLLNLVAYYLIRPHKYKELIIIKTFRKEREKLAESGREGISKLQYEVCAAKLGVSDEKVNRLIEKWILRKPLKYMADARYRNIQELFAVLRENQIKVAVYSDYPAKQKLEKLGLTADLVVSADHPEIDRLKPHPAGLQFIMKHFGLAAAQCLMIGDRDDRDGKAARQAQMPFQLVTPDPDSVYLKLINYINA